MRGVGFRIHNTLKGGHRESVYEETLVWILEKDNVSYLRQQRYLVHYKGRQVGKYYPDLMLAEGKVVLDLKVASQIEVQHKAQVLSYAAVTNAELGFIMNFGVSSLQTERLPNFLDGRKPLEWQATIPKRNLQRYLTTCHFASLQLCNLSPSQ